MNEEAFDILAHLGRNFLSILATKYEKDSPVNKDIAKAMERASEEVLYFSNFFLEKKKDIKTRAATPTGFRGGFETVDEEPFPACNKGVVSGARTDSKGFPMADQLRLAKAVANAYRTVRVGCVNILAHPTQACSRTYWAFVGASCRSPAWLGKAAWAVPGGSARRRFVWSKTA